MESMQWRMKSMHQNKEKIKKKKPSKKKPKLNKYIKKKNSLGCCAVVQRVVNYNCKTHAGLGGKSGYWTHWHNSPLTRITICKVLIIFTKDQIFGVIFFLTRRSFLACFQFAHTSWSSERATFLPVSELLELATGSLSYWKCEQPRPSKTKL